jgi:Kef-type K+ transport system membrane component KefB
MSQVAIADVAAIVALPLVVLSDGASGALLGGALVAGAGLAVFGGARALRGSALVHRVRRTSKKRGWALDLRLALLLLFVLAWLAQRTGTSVLVAGFTVGLLVAAVGGPKRLSRQVIGIAAGFFVPLFFVVLGARLDLRAVLDHPSYLVLAGLLVAANVVVHAIAALLSGQGPPAALAATAQLGVPAGVVAIGLAEGVITPGQGGAIILAALASIGLCTLGVGRLARGARAAGAAALAPGASRVDRHPAG